MPTHVPNLRISDFDMSYRVWSQRVPGFTAIDGAEVWNVPLALANLLVRPGGIAVGRSRSGFIYANLEAA